MKTVVLIFLLPLTIFSQLLTNSTSINITKTWFQEPSGWTYPMIVSVPNTPVPANGYPVCILLHGNGGQGQGMITEFQNNLSCHALIAPTGYQNSWNISNEGSDAPDVEMIADLVNQLQTFSNVDASKIRIIGYSNGSALGNRVLLKIRIVENKNSWEKLHIIRVKIWIIIWIFIVDLICIADLFFIFIKNFIVFSIKTRI